MAGIVVSRRFRMSFSTDKKPNDGSELENTKPERNDETEPPEAVHVEIIKMLTKEDIKTVNKKEKSRD
jgi:hypothetical protein